MKSLASFCILFFLLYSVKCISSSLSTSQLKKTVTIIVILYSIVVLFITLGNRSYGENYEVVIDVLRPIRIVFTILSEGYANAGIKGVIRRIPWIAGTIEGIVLNIALFVPFGYLVPFLHKRLSSCRSVVALSFIVSLFIEIAQLLLHCGWFDLGDILMNTLGSIMGFRLFQQISSNKRNS